MIQLKTRPRNLTQSISHTPDIPMTVSQLRVFRSGLSETGYYVCPRCNASLDREFVSYCDRCGQKLDWSRYKKAELIYPNFPGSSTIRDQRFSDQGSGTP